MIHFITYVYITDNTFWIRWRKGFGITHIIVFWLFLKTIFNLKLVKVFETTKVWSLFVVRWKKNVNCYTENEWFYTTPMEMVENGKDYYTIAKNKYIYFLFCEKFKCTLIQNETKKSSKLLFFPYFCPQTTCHIHYIAKSIGSPPSNERFDYFSNFHENKS